MSELIRCNVFHNGLNGIEALGSVQTLVVSDCSIHDNLNGINRWLFNVQDATELKTIAEMYLAENTIHDNRRDECKVRAMPMDGRSLADVANDENVCTFLLTGPQFISQVNTFRHFFRHFFRHPFYKALLTVLVL